MKKKKEIIVFRFPKEMFKEFAGTEFLPNGSSKEAGMFFQNKRFGKKAYNKDGLLPQIKECRVDHGVIRANGEVSVTATFTLKELEAFVKKAKARKAMFDKMAKKEKKKRHGFFLHLTPELTFIIEG